MSAPKFKDQEAWRQVRPFGFQCVTEIAEREIEIPYLPKMKAAIS